MDINNYSYTGNDFANDYSTTIANYENDDMYCTIDRAARGNIGNLINGYTVTAASYDGTMDICEFYETLQAAQQLHDAITTNFAHCPPTKRETRALINAAKKTDKKH